MKRVVKYHFFKYYLVIFLLTTVSCTHEYEEVIENDWRVDLNITFSDPEFWPDNQQIRIGVFDNDSYKVPVASVIINRPEGKTASVSMSNVPEGTYDLQLYLTENSVYKAVVTDLGTLNVITDIAVEPETVSLLTYSRIQNQVFANCQVCHGGSSGELAAELDLTKENSYNSLVNVPAVNNPLMIRVLPGAARNSYLIKVLEKEVDFDHPASSTATDDDIQLIIDWINTGAKK